MIPIAIETRSATALAARMILARPRLVALFVAAQIVSNLVRPWIGQAGNGSMFLVAVGGIFVLGRIFLTQWLHVASARMADDPAVSLPDAFRVAPRQAVWFHVMALVSMATF